MSLTQIEQEMSKKLERFPTVKRYVSDIYHEMNYKFFGNSNLTENVHHKIDITTPSEWADVDESNSEEFFGYYDKTPWSPNGNQAVFHEIASNDKLNIVVYDKYSSDRYVVGNTQAWNYQQGAMTQWISNDNIIFNDIKENKLISKIASVSGGETKQLPLPIQTVHTGDKSALSLNYRRLDKFRPQYGYSESVSNFSTSQNSDEDGIWHLDLETGQYELLVSLEEVLKISPQSTINESDHWLNHIFYTPDGNGCVFMHRWKQGGERLSQLIYYNIESNNAKILLNDGKVSHYCWFDNNNLLVWGKYDNKKQYLIIDVLKNTTKKTSNSIEINEFGDGHPSFSEKNGYFVTDTYPGRDRMQNLLIFQLNSDSVTRLGRFHAPLKFSDSFSCDLHPRWSPCGKYVSFDSAHSGKRKTYIANIKDIV